MVTLVGTQNKFSDAVKELVELIYDVVDAYQVAIDKISNIKLKLQFIAFKKEHEQKIKELSNLLTKHSQTAPTGPSLAKQWIAKGKIVLANLFNNKAILMAVKSNEDDANAAYENMLKHAEKWPDAQPILLQGLAEVRRHRDNLEFSIDAKGDSFE